MDIMKNTNHNEKNILVVFLSRRVTDLKKKKKMPALHYKVTDNNGVLKSIDGKETNDPYVIFLMDQLQNHGGLTNIYMICSKNVKSNNGHEDFKKMVEDYCFHKRYAIPDIDQIDYDEDINSKEAALMSVLALSEEFQKDFGSISEKNISVYMDFTGGMRDTALLMSAILRLFAFQEIKVKQIMYAYLDHENKDNPDGNHHMSDLTDIYRLYDLVAGAEEFTSYGSVENLQNYYKGREISNELRNLLDSMAAFSKNLKLCAFGQFEKTLGELKSAIDCFDRKKNKSQSEQIFEILMKRIMLEYKHILKDDSDLLDLIQWCINNDYIQQALTLLSEMLPRYVVTEKRIIYPENLFTEDGFNENDEWKSYIEDFNKKKGAKWIPWESTFFSQFDELIKHKQIKDKNIENNPKFNEEIVFGDGFDEKMVKEIRKIRKEIKDLRNKINHASEVQKDGEKMLTYEDIKEQLISAHQELTQIIKKEVE